MPKIDPPAPTDVLTLIGEGGAYSLTYGIVDGRLMFSWDGGWQLGGLTGDPTEPLGISPVLYSSLALALAAKAGALYFMRPRKVRAEFAKEIFEFVIAEAAKSGKLGEMMRNGKLSKLANWAAECRCQYKTPDQPANP